LPSLGRIAIAAALVCLAMPAGATADRSEEPVLILGASFPDFSGEAIQDLALFRYDDVSDAFEPVPFQIDERIVDRVFKEGTSFEFTETIYDIYGEDDGLLDGDDELVFLFGDAGPQATAATPWPAGAASQRYEVEIHDPRPGAPEAERYVYLFLGNGLATSPTSYVSWTISAMADATTPVYTLDYMDKWLLIGLEVASPCGTGADLLDRVKGRGGATLDSGETEQNWNNAAAPANSTFMGGLVGPVRAIRYVMGALSAVNTIHHDRIYRGLWERRTDLRVHPVQRAFLYLDWLPSAGATLYLPDDPAGLAVDGSQETPTGWGSCPGEVAGACGSIPDWALYRTPAGGMVFFMDLPPSPHYQGSSAFYLDDDEFNDQTQLVPVYLDDDDEAHDLGIVLEGPGGNGVDDAISSSWSVYPLCADTGDATLGADYREFVDHPLGVATLAQFEVLGPIESVTAYRDGDDVVLEWQTVNGASSYRVYASEFADLPRTTWASLGDTATLDFRDSGAAVLAADRHYSVVAIGPGGEGEH
jgi:hypothetical protein